MCTRNTTNCIVVWRAYRDDEKTVRVKEYLFHDNTSCRRYCVLFGGRNPIIMNVTEHDQDFFHRVLHAECGVQLYNLYVSEKIDPVPIGSHIPHSRKYECLTELCVTFNILFDEANIVEALNQSRSRRVKYALLKHDACA